MDRPLVRREEDTRRRRLTTVLIVALFTTLGGIIAMAVLGIDGGPLNGTLNVIIASLISIAVCHNSANPPRRRR
ncbi:hypothetical protein [Actinosynnema sp. NPDC023587]|uniref:hypothetical protein n=1 Tax=Actinosynnema sp. NPDC023587 TaxID=3154695 RepID=UPI0033D55D38